jgi:HAD superfamily hydrolase (TIGR01549 family)
MFENKKGRIRGVIFDLDGTLIDSSKGIIESLFSAIYSNGVEPAFTVNDSHFFMGKSLKETLEIVVPRTNRELKDKIARHYVDHYYDNQINNAILFPGVEQTLDKLKSKGLKLAVATAKHSFCAKAELEITKVDHYFDTIRGTDEGIPSKPSPELLFEICQKFKMEPRDVLMVGDTDRDVLFARNAGAISCSVTYGNWSKEMFIANKIEPDFYIDDFSQVLGHVI